MSSHRSGGDPRAPIPNWLKAWYATLVFLTLITITTVLANYR